MNCSLPICVREVVRDLVLMKNDSLFYFRETISMMGFTQFVPGVV
jgi:hypothetical protein